MKFKINNSEVEYKNGELKVDETTLDTSDGLGAAIVYLVGKNEINKHLCILAGFVDAKIVVNDEITLTTFNLQITQKKKKTEDISNIKPKVF